MTHDKKMEISRVVMREFGYPIGGAVLAALEVAQQHWSSKDTDTWGTKVAAVITE